MTTAELRTAVINNIDYLMDDEDAMRRLERYTARLRREGHSNMLSRRRMTPRVIAPEKPYDTKEEIVTGVREAMEELKEYKAGRASFRPLDELIEESTLKK